MRNEDKVRAVADGDLSRTQIAAITGVPASTVCKILRRCPDIPRRQPGPPRGTRNPFWRGGRCVDADGYVTVPAPEGHPHARRIGRIAEHRLVLERHLGRHLEPHEVVDHRDGLTLHNAPSNLRLFATNGQHLSETLKGRAKATSATGHRHILEQGRLPEGFAPVDTYRRRKARGDVRLRAILRAALTLGIDSPFLSGTHRLLGQAGIHPVTRSTIERAWGDLCARWEADLLL